MASDRLGPMIEWDLLPFLGDIRVFSVQSYKSPGGAVAYLTNGPVLIRLMADWQDDRVDCWVTIGGRCVQVDESLGRRARRVISRATRQASGVGIPARLRQLGEMFAASDGPVAVASERRVEQVVGFVDASVNVRLAAGLAVAERVRSSARQAETRGLDDLLEHMWSWMCVTPETFSDWEEWSSPVLASLLDRSSHGSAQTEDEAFVRLYRSLVNLVYDHIFAAVMHPVSLYDLHEVALIAQDLGAALPSASEVGVLYRDDGRNEWGRRLTMAEVDDLRRRLADRMS